VFGTYPRQHEREIIGTLGQVVSITLCRAFQTESPPSAHRNWHGCQRIAPPYLRGCVTEKVKSFTGLEEDPHSSNHQKMYSFGERLRVYNGEMRGDMPHPGPTFYIAICSSCPRPLVQNRTTPLASATRGRRKVGTSRNVHSA